MKKTIAIVALAATLASCGGSTSTETTPTDSTTVTVDTTKTVDSTKVTVDTVKAAK
jgi:ABC-type glycerol-3-phosphate transport system substrate-binding protein